MYKPLAAAVAAGAAAAYSLEMLYKNPDDLAQMKDLKSNMISIIRQGFPQLPGLLHLVDGTNPWPTIVAESVRKNREGDGSDAGMLHISFTPTVWRILLDSQLIQTLRVKLCQRQPSLCFLLRAAYILCSLESECVTVCVN